MAVRQEITRAYMTELVRQCLGEGEDATDVARKLNLHPGYARRLLREARKEEHFEIIIRRDRTDPLVRLVSEVLAPYGIRDLVVLPNYVRDEKIDSPEYEAFLRRSLGHRAAQYVSAFLEREPVNGDVHVVTSGGRTLVDMASKTAFPPTPNGRIVLRPLAAARGQWRAQGHADANGVIQTLYVQATGGVEYGRTKVGIIFPEVPEKKVKGIGTTKQDSFQGNRLLERVFGETSPQPRLVVSTVGLRHYEKVKKGELAPHWNTSWLVRSVGETLFVAENKVDPADIVYEHLPDKTYERANDLLEKAHTIGAVARHGICPDGTVAKTQYLDNRFVGVNPTTLQAWAKSTTTSSVLVSGGSKFTPAVGAAISGRYFNAVILDSAVALRLIPKARRPRMYADIEEESPLLDAGGVQC